MPQPRQKLLLDFGEAPTAPPRPHIQYRGFSAEHVPLGASSAFDYKWAGPAHYLAVHDIRLSEGEIFVDGELASRLCDLRHRLTFVPKGSAVSGWSSPGKHTNSFTAMYFRPEEMINEVLEQYRAAPLFPSVYFQDAALLSTLQKLTALLQRRTAGDGLYAESLGLLAIVELLRVQRSQIRPSRLNKGGLSHRQQVILRDYVEDYLHTDISLSDLATVVGLTRFHFARAFAVSFGEPPYRYLSRRRVEFARQLLRDTNLDVSEIAEKVGLKSVTMLSRHMRKLVGVTPLEFRRSAS